MANDAVDGNSSPVVTGAALLGLVALVVAVAARPPSWWTLAALVVVLAAAASLLAVSGGCLIDASAPPHVPSPAEGRTRPPLPLIGATVVVVGITAILADRATSDGRSASLLVWSWLLGIALLVILAWWEELARAIGRLRRGVPLPVSASWRMALPWLGMIAVAALPRIWWLDRFPTVLDSDEAAFMLAARAWQQGALANPFSPGFLGNPNLYAVAQGLVAGLAGSDVADYRLLSALLGTVAVLATWRLGRYVVGSWDAVAGAVLLATMPFNLHFSRSALNNVSDAATLAVATLFAVRAVTFHRAGDAVLSGIALGFGFYGYFGGRALPAVILVGLAMAAAGRRVPARDALRLVGWLVTGFAVVALPLLAFFRAHPDVVGSRLHQVSPLTLAGFRDDPAGTAQVYLESLRDAAMYPLTGNMMGFLRREPPYIGWPLAILLAFGVAVWLARTIRERDVAILAWLVMPWVLLSAGIALTIPIASQRLVVLTPIWALAAGSGLVVAARWLLADSRRVPGMAVTVAIALALIAVGAGDLRWIASEDRQIVNYGDRRTLAMWDIGWRVTNVDEGSGDAPLVLFAGPPYLFTGGFHNLLMLAPELVMTDVVEPLGNGPAPFLADGAMLVIVPERAEERCAAERLYPTAVVAEARDRRGALLYIALYRSPLHDWSLAETPAGTSFAVVEASLCQGV